MAGRLLRESTFLDKPTEFSHIQALPDATVGERGHTVSAVKEVV
jgi:hypothetical protein